MLTRREIIQRWGGGLGALGLATVLSDDAARADAAKNSTAVKPQQAPTGVIAGPAPRAGTPVPHFTPRAKRVIQLFMNGGPFQADLFDPKPAINKYAGQRPREVSLRTENQTGGLMPVPYRFASHGNSGLEISELLPRLSAHADDLCVIRSLHTDNPNHGPALFMMNNGTITPNRPSMGAWFSYGLGTENADLPGYVVLCPGRPVRFAELWTASFLPGEHQGTYLNHSQTDPARMFPFLHNNKWPKPLQRGQLDLLGEINNEHSRQRDQDPALEARIRALETAYRMQTAAHVAFDIRQENASTRAAYGTSAFAQGCLLARRLVERGVRFVQVYYGNGQPWDTHRNHNATTRNLCKDIDQPLAALLTDLKQRGLLEETLVLWNGEFGRTSTSESGDGRDHNHWGFCAWMAGGGVRGGMSYGATDDFGFRALHDKVHVHDLHATVLHLLGLDHEKLTFRYAGRDFRLTDVHGRVVREILA